MNFRIKTSIFSKFLTAQCASLGLLCAIFFYCGPAIALSEDVAQKGGFYSKGSVRDLFGADLESVDGLEIEHFPRIKEREKPELLKVNSQPKLPTNSAQPEIETKQVEFISPPVTTEEEYEKAQKSTRESILAKYGDPEKDAPLKAQDSAPGPFKAMLEALEGGDDKLAFQYARQYVRYVNNFQAKTERITGMVGIAQESQGMLEKGGWASDPRFDRDRKLAEEYEKERRAEQQRLLELDDFTKALLRRAAQAEKLGEAFGFAEEIGGKEAPNPGSANALQEQDLLGDATLQAAERARARKELGGRLPQAGKGGVEVYFLFRPRDSRAQAMAQDINSLYKAQTARGAAAAKVAGVMLDAHSPLQLNSFKNLTKVSFPVSSSEKLAQTLNLKVLPAVVFVAANSGRAHVETDHQSAAYLDEIVRMMEGR